MADKNSPNPRMDEEEDGVDFPPPPPAAAALQLDEAARYPSFARYMKRCLYDPTFGYYGSGKVAFGRSRHFWTYPQRLRPLFGWMVAEVARSLFESLASSGSIGADTQLTILELGGGEGDLARDTLDYILERAKTKAWSPYSRRVRYVIGEPSEPLRRRQRIRLRHYVESGRADMRELDAGNLYWEDSFFGLVIANELLTSFPCERLRVVAPGPAVHRIHVVPLVDAGWGAEAGIPPTELYDLPAAFREILPGSIRSLDESQFWRLVQEERWEDKWEDGKTGGRLAELEVPLSLGWCGGSGRPARPPQGLLDYLKALEPLVADLETCSLLPVDIHWSPQLPHFVTGLASLLSGSEERRGIALILDYGGTSRHVLDPRSMGNHFRIYGGLRLYDHKPLPYLGPSSHDLTYDLDFTEVARLARAAGLRIPFFGHQSALEMPPVDLWAPAPRQHLIRGRISEGMDDPSEAELEAHELVLSFREAPGYRCLLLQGADTPYDPDCFGDSDLLDGPGLRTLKRGVHPQKLAARFAMEGLPPQVAACLKPCGDPVADLSDRHLYGLRNSVLRILNQNGWLAEPRTL